MADTKKAESHKRKAPPTQLLDVLTTTQAQDVIGAQLRDGMVTATKHDTIADVCARMAERGVAAAPVVEGNENTVGVVDFYDVVSHVLKDVNARPLHDLKDDQDLVAASGHHKIGTTLDIHTKPVTMTSVDTLERAAKYFGAKRCRRLLVIEPSTPKSPKSPKSSTTTQPPATPTTPSATTEAAPKTPNGKDESDKNLQMSPPLAPPQPIPNVRGVLTASALLKYLVESVSDKQTSPWTLTVGALRLGTTPVVSVKKSQSVLDAMNTMLEKRVRVVAVLDDQTHSLVGNISFSDIKHVFFEKRFSVLLQSCWELIQSARARTLCETVPVYSVRETATLGHVAAELAATHVHYLYVVEEKTGKPLRVISVNDIFGALVGDKAISGGKANQGESSESPKNNNNDGAASTKSSG